MPASDITADVLAILADNRGRPAQELKLDDRLLHDLGMDGDDAAEFFDRVHKQFGTDMSALDERWSKHFNDEGIAPVGAGLMWVALAAGVGALGAEVASLSPLWGGLVFAAVAFGGRLAWTRWGPPDPMIAITVREVVAAVEAGAWPRGPVEP